MQFLYVKSIYTFCSNSNNFLCKSCLHWKIGIFQSKLEMGRQTISLACLNIYSKIAYTAVAYFCLLQAYGMVNYNNKDVYEHAYVWLYCYDPEKYSMSRHCREKLKKIVKKKKLHKQVIK